MRCAAACLGFENGICDNHLCGTFRAASIMVVLWNA